MDGTAPFLDRLEHDLRGAYSRHQIRRRRRRATLLVAAAALVLVAAAGAATGLLGSFTIDQSAHVSISGVPPQLIACDASGCTLATTAAPAGDGRLLYEFSHRLGDDLPSSGAIAESIPGQGVFDAAGNKLVPPPGAELAFVCTTIEGGTLGCSALSAAGSTLPRGAAIYILSPREYVPRR